MKKHFQLLCLAIIPFVTNAQMKPAPQDSIRKADSTVLLRRIMFENPFTHYNYFNQMGVMCKVEYKMQHAIKLPLCFRIGSLEECKKMETVPAVIHP